MRHLIGTVFLITSFLSAAQTGKIVGKVRDTKGEVLIGASVLVIRTTRAIT
jgi:hypothetical protein